MKKTQGESAVPGISRLLAVSGTRKYLLATAALFALASAFCALAPHILVYRIMMCLLDPAFGPESYNRIWVWALGAAGIAALRYLLMFVSAVFSHMAAFEILYGLRRALAHHLGQLPMGYFTRNRTGKIKKILYEDVEEIEKFVAHHIPDIVAGIIVPLVVVGFLFFVDWRMALVALLPLPLAFFTQQKAFKNEGRGRYHDALETMNATIVEYVRGMPVVKIFNQSTESFAWLRDAVLAYRAFTRKLALDAGPSWAAFITITASGLAFILPFGIGFYAAGMITLPVLLLFLMLGSGYMTPLFKLAALGGQLGQITEGVKRIDTILAEPVVDSPACGQGRAGQTTPDRSPGIRFENVSFSYGEKQVLHDISFSVDPGTVTALVGPSGSGKSTIAGLIMRYWEPSKGAIRLGGTPIRSIPVTDLMAHIGFVSQDIFIFSDTVYENIRMGKKGAGLREVEAAARAAQCLGFIRELPDGFETRIGEGGRVHLSGGEKQRISMARILLKDAPVVVLDEATAYADAENEAKIQQAFAEIMRGRTVLVIAHRLSSIVDADRILVIHDGCLAQQGRHRELCSEKGIYRDMWEAHTRSRNWTIGRGGHA